MTILKSERKEKIQIDLDGPDGNAFVLLGMANKFLKGNPNKESILADMKSGNYIHLVSVFEEEFGDYVDLYTNQEDLLAILGD